MVISALFLYPVKSLRGIPVDRLALRGGRPVGDREWILVDNQGRFLHQRDLPAMARLAVRLGEPGLVIEAEGLSPLVLPDASAASGNGLGHVRLWRRAAPVIHVPEGDAWFSAALGFSCHLLAFAPAVRGLDVPDYEIHSSLQDATPFHLTSEDSLSDLNSRLPEPIPMIRFRPNIVVRSAPPYDEDHWSVFQAGAIEFSRIKACTRCAITTTDHQTGARSREPLRTLSTYRRVGNEVVFGQYVTARSLEGELRIGDPVQCLIRE
jgi:uncharacterized protein YcbX